MKLDLRKLRVRRQLRGLACEELQSLDSGSDGSEHEIEASA